MNYEGQICRAPMERSAFMLPVIGRLFLQWMQILQPVPPFKVQKTAYGTDRGRAQTSERVRGKSEEDFSGRRKCL